MDFIFAALTIISVTLLGAASPGPDTALIFKNALLGSRKNAFATVFGIIAGNIVYVVIAVFGLGVIIVESGAAYLLVQILGALYLFYLGVKLLRTKSVLPDSQDQAPVNATAWSAFGEGLTTNVLNPKFVLFLLALFSQVVLPEWSLHAKLVLGMLVPLTAFGVFSFLVFTITHARFRGTIVSSRVWIERVMGAVLVALAAKVLLSLSP